MAFHIADLKEVKRHGGDGGLTGCDGPQAVVRDDETLDRDVALDVTAMTQPEVLQIDQSVERNVDLKPVLHV